MIFRPACGVPFARQWAGNFVVGVWHPPTQSNTFSILVGLVSRAGKGRAREGLAG